MKTSKTTVINAPTNIVFPWLDDDERIRQWVPNIVEDEVIIDTPEKVGSKFRQVFLERGKRMEMIGEIMEYTENERMRVDMAGEMFSLDVDYWLKSLSPGKTELTQNSTIKFKGVFKLFVPIMILVSKFSKIDAQDEAHAKLKELAEAEYQAGKPLNDA